MWLGEEDQDMAWLRRTSYKCEGKGFEATNYMWRGSLSKDLASMDKGNGEEQAMLQSMNQRSHDDMEWILSFKEDQTKG